MNCPIHKNPMDWIPAERHLEKPADGYWLCDKCEETEFNKSHEEDYGNGFDIVVFTVWSKP